MMFKEWLRTKRVGLAHWFASKGDSLAYRTFVDFEYWNFCEGCGKAGDMETDLVLVSEHDQAWLCHSCVGECEKEDVPLDEVDEIIGVKRRPAGGSVSDFKKIAMEIDGIKKATCVEMTVIDAKMTVLFARFRATAPILEALHDELNNARTAGVHIKVYEFGTGTLLLEVPR